MGFQATFNFPITTLAATLNGTGNTSIIRLLADTDIVGNLPTLVNRTVGFYGFIAEGSFNTVTFQTASNQSDNFGVDNVLYGSATPVPFEFSPVIGLGVLGGLWSMGKVCKAFKNKSIK